MSSIFKGSIAEQIEQSQASIRSHIAKAESVEDLLPTIRGLCQPYTFNLYIENKNINHTNV